MHKILLTGVGGQVGHELQRSLQGLGTVIAPTRNQLDLGNADVIRNFVQSCNPTLIINPAAYTAVDAAESDQEGAFAINARAPEVLADCARVLGIPLIHYSTDYVFSGEGNTPWREGDALAPQNAYGSSKLAGEEAIRASGCNHLILRTSWVYAARGKNFLLTMLRLARERDALSVIDDQFGAPTWCRTIADITAHIVAQRPDWNAVTGAYHLVNSGVTTWHGFASAIFSEAAKKGMKVPTLSSIPTEQYPLPAKRPKNSRLDTTRLEQTFGIVPPDWQTALALCMGDIALA